MHCFLSGRCINNPTGGIYSALESLSCPPLIGKFQEALPACSEGGMPHFGAPGRWLKCGSFRASAGAGLSRLAEEEAKRLVEGALAAAKECVAANRTAHEGLSAELEARERLDGPALARWLQQVTAPASLRAFVLQGAPPAALHRR